MWLTRRRSYCFDLVAHRARLAEIDGRRRAALALNRELAHLPSPVHCWQNALLRRLPAGRPRQYRGPLVQVTTMAHGLYMDLSARNLPVVVVEPQPALAAWALALQAEAVRRARTTPHGARRPRD